MDNQLAMHYKNLLGTCRQRTETSHYATLVHINRVLGLDPAVLVLPDIEVPITAFGVKPSNLAAS